MKILLLEDNLSLSQDLKKMMLAHEMVVETAETLTTATDKVAVYSYDLAIIDLGLPDGNGLDIISFIKEKDPLMGILILTANNTIDNKVKGLDLGADDYLTKPFHWEELNARIRSIQRRKKGNGKNVINVGPLTINILSKECLINDNPLKLTKKEYQLLLYFAYNPNRVLTKESIAEHLWGDHIDQTDSFDFVYNHIKNLRKKLALAPNFDPIQAVYGMGYKFNL